MLQTHLEQFQLLQLIPISVLSFNCLGINFLLINLLALLNLISFIYYSAFYSNYLLEAPLFFSSSSGRKALIFMGINIIIFTEHIMKTFFLVSLGVSLDFVSYLAKPVRFFLCMLLLQNFTFIDSILPMISFVQVFLTQVFLNFSWNARIVIFKIMWLVIRYRHKHTKSSFLDRFLKFQFSVCHGDVILSHSAFLSLATITHVSFYWTVAYVLVLSSIFFIIFLCEEFPDSFGFMYFSFLKKYSSPKAFEKYCGDSGHSLRSAVIAQFGEDVYWETVSILIIFHAIYGALIPYIIQHIVNYGMMDQQFKYFLEILLNGGEHPSGRPFRPGPVGLSLLDRFLGRGDIWWKKNS